jgi:Sortilin, neurotensin receptor 3,
MPGERFLGFYHHKYSPDRAYLITDTSKFIYTTDAGAHWYTATAPTPPNTFGAQVLRFHPNSDYLIWTGNRDCEEKAEKCRAEAQYSRDNGRRWSFVEDYVRNCAWTRDRQINSDPNEILCESLKVKTGSQRIFMDNNPLELVVGENFFQRKKKMFDEVVGFAKFSEYLVVAAVSLFLCTCDGSVLMIIIIVGQKRRSFTRIGSLAERDYVCNWPIPAEYASGNSCMSTFFLSSV